MIKASSIVLRPWKPAKSSDTTDWVNVMVKDASYLLNRLRGRRDLFGPTVYKDQLKYIDKKKLL